MNNANYTFTYSEPDSKTPGFPSSKDVEMHVTFDDGIQWTKVADEFFNFLSSIYGYRCSAKKYAEYKEAGI